jgi:hypothetical protein
MKSIHALFAMLLLALCAIPCLAADPQPDEVWVNIRYQAGINLPATEYYGTIRKADLAAMLGSTGKIAGLLKITRVAYMDGGQLYPLAETLANGSKFGFKNVMYIRADTVLRVIELDDTFVTQRLLPLKE